MFLILITHSKVWNKLLVKTIDLSTNNNKVDISHLSKGMYFGNVVKNNNIISTKKLIVK